MTNLVGFVRKWWLWLVIGLPVVVLLGWYGGESIVSAIAAHRLKDLEAKYQEQIQQSKQEIAGIHQTVSALTADKRQLKSEIAQLDATNKRLEREKQAWIQQADALAQRLQTVQQEVARVPDSEVRARLRGALVRLRLGASVGPSRGAAPRPQ